MTQTKKLFWILFLLNLLNYFDRQVLYSVFPLLQTDLQLTDLQLGTLASAFMVVYMCYAPLVGFFADRTPRHKWIGLSALIWSGATLLCATAKNFSSLLLARGVIGAGEAGFTTIAQPFLAEHFPAEKRASLLAKFGLALPLGAALGYTLGGWIGEHVGWREAFLVAGIPGLFFGLLAWISLSDKTRIVPTFTAPSWHDYLQLLKNKPFLCVCFTQAMVTFVMGGLSAWTPMYLHRYLQFSPSQAGTYFGALVIVCGALGTFAGGKAADKLLMRTSHAYYWIMGISLLLIIPFLLLATHTTHPYYALAYFAGGIICVFLPTGAIAAALVATTAQEVRSMAFAANIFLIHLLGDTLSPLFIGWAADIWNLKSAMMLCGLAVIPGICFAYKAAGKQFLLPRRF